MSAKRTGTSATAEGKDRQRERALELAREMGDVTVSKRSVKLVELLKRVAVKTWADDIEPHAVHCGDIAMKVETITTSRGGYVTMTWVVPPEYVSTAIQMYRDSQRNITWARMYAVPTPKLLADDEEVVG